MLNRYQFHAGYILDHVKEAIEHLDKPNKTKGLLRYLSCFDVETNVSLDLENREPLLAVLHNIVSKGIPTRPSVYLEERFLASFEKGIRDTSEFSKQLGNIKYVSDFSDEEKQLAFDALHIIDPRLKLNNENYKPELESSFESDFIFKYLPEKNLSFLAQLLQPQRKLATIINPEMASDFHSQRVDFSYEFPYILEKKYKQYGEEKTRKYNQGIVIEIDGSQYHDPIDQKILDASRDKAVLSTDWQVVRIKSLETTTFDNWIRKSASVKILEKNFNTPLESNWLNILQLTLSPMAIARVQKVLLELLISGQLHLEDKEWRILVIERDLPCFQLAIQDLFQQIEILYRLAGKEVKLPALSLTNITTKEFEDSPLYNDTPISSDEGAVDSIYDCIFDISVLQRSDLLNNDTLSDSRIYCSIRSSHYSDSKRTIYTSSNVKYRPITIRKDDESYRPIEDAEKGLTFFLQNIFRKENFREGQLPILNRALQGKSVIGLLPTGGGKSLTYQLASLLQPGVTIVIDPIKSLMQDQYDNLVKNGIDSCNFINSKLTRAEKSIATRELIDSTTLFTFVSPERLQIEEFRISLKEMFKNKVYFSYCVIDEVHCVSEWGHDFRTSYLSLGKNAILNCRTKHKTPVPIFGLTATASFDVLSDVERELSGNGLIDLDPEAIIRFENSNRTELQYQVVPVEREFEREENFKINLGEDHVIQLPFDPLKGNIKLEVAEAKQSVLLDLVNDLPNQLQNLNRKSELIKSWTSERFSVENGLLPDIEIHEFQPTSFFEPQESYGKTYYKNGGIVFCPHRSHMFGVTDKFKFDTYSEDQLDENGILIHKRGDYVLDDKGNKVKLPLEKRKGIADALEKNNYNAVGTFMGSSDEDEKTGKEVEIDSFENQRKFIENEQNIMVATKAFGMGIDKPNVRYTMHINIPASIESFVQEAGRAGRDRKMALGTILYNKQKIAYFNPKFYEKIEEEINDEVAFKLLEKLKGKRFFKEEIPRIIDALGSENISSKKKEILNAIGEIFVDKDNLLFFHHNSFKGQEKEMVVIEELLEEILMPIATNLSRLTKSLQEEIDSEDIYLKLDTKSNRIYVNENYPKGYGYIDLVHLQPNVYYSTFDKELSLQVVSFLIEEIKLQFPNYSNLAALKTWLGIKTLNETVDGIQVRLSDTEYGDPIAPHVVIPFENRYADRNSYHQELIDTFKEIVTERVADEAIISSIEGTFSNFIGSIADKLKLTLDETEEKFAVLKKLYYSPRRKADTDKAIFRLSSMGIIDDYTVDYNKNCYTLSIKKKKDAEYYDSLRQFMRKYYSVNRVESEIEKLQSVEGDSVLHRCLSFLTDFVYREIEAKRIRSIEDMILACEIGMQENGNEELKDFIHLYFNSKYAKENHEIDGEPYSLTLDTEQAREYNFDIVWKYIKATLIDPSGAQKDNTKHLRGATLRLLRTQPQNGSLLLLKAYSLFVLGIGKNKNMAIEAKESLIQGFKELKIKHTELSFEEFTANVNRYRDEIIQNANETEEVTEILDQIIEQMYLDFHNDWLKNFTKKYLLEYDR